MNYPLANTALPAEPFLASHNSGNVPCVLTPPDIREFQQLVQEHCGMSLTETEAWNRATELVALYRMFLGPIPEDPAIVGLDGIQVPESQEP
jgi:hypothetical protein